MSRLKIIILILGISALVSLSFRSAPKSQEIEWLDIETAMEQARVQQKPIFVDVYTDWCSWCVRMDRVTFENEEIIEYVNENYIAVKLNAENASSASFLNQNYTYRQLAVDRFGVRGFPTIVFINADGSQVKAEPGFQKPNDFRALMDKFREGE